MQKQAIRILSILLVCTLLFSDMASKMVLADAGVTVTTLDELRLRAKPDVTSAVLATVPSGTKLTAISKDATGQWVKVGYQDKFGWLNIKYLQVDGNFAALPTGDVAPPQGPAPTPAGPPDGSIASLDLYTSTKNANYYRLSYWSDGLRIIGWMASPKDTTRVHPGMIYNRGGSATGGWVTPVELAPFAESGYVVVASQYRGSAGSQGADQFGGDDVHDVTNLITVLKGLPNVDPARLGMFGQSRGGMMTYLALKQQTLDGRHDIKVAATVSGVTDLILWAQERADLNQSFFPGVLGMTTTSNPDAFKARSATYWASQIRVPLLIEHGGGDYEVSPDQAKKLAAKMGGRAKLIIYPGEGHGIRGRDNGYPAAMKFFQPFLAGKGEDLTFEAHSQQITDAYLILRH